METSSAASLSALRNNSPYELRYVHIERDLPTMSNIASAQQQIEDDERMRVPSPNRDKKILPSIASAIEMQNYALVSYLLPLLSAKDTPEKLILLAIDAGIEIYKLFYTNSPAILEYQWQGLGDVVCVALKAGNIDLLRYVLSIGADPGRSFSSVRLSYIFLPVEFASYNSLCEPESELQVLIDHGALVKGTCALQLAAQFGKLDAVRILLQAGAEVDALPKTSIKPEDLTGTEQVVGSDFHYIEDTALHLAASGGMLEVVKLLLEHGADPEVLDAKGCTALMRAEKVGHTAVTELLERQKGT